MTRQIKDHKLIAVPFGVVAVILVIASAAYACTNYVGTLAVKGNRSANVATATGSQTFGCSCESMTQSVSASTAQADIGASSGSFTITTGRISTAKSLGTATYDVNQINVGYSNHTTWINPSGDCMTWTIGSSTKNLGTITTANGVATKGFNVYTTFIANTGSEESGVCVSDSGSHNGNQVPLRLIV